jgi:hypothetical protein
MARSTSSECCLTSRLVHSLSSKPLGKARCNVHARSVRPALIQPHRPDGAKELIAFR